LVLSRVSFVYRGVLHVRIEDGGIRGGDVVGKTIIGFNTSGNTRKPRWYYNISKKRVNGKIIKK
jgi:hypothetical protein